MILFPCFSNSTHPNSHKGQEIKRDRENERKIHVKSLLCKSLTGDVDELMKSLTKRCTARQQQTEADKDRSEKEGRELKMRK